MITADTARAAALAEHAPGPDAIRYAAGVDPRPQLADMPVQVREWMPHDEAWVMQPAIARWVDQQMAAAAEHLREVGPSLLDDPRGWLRAARELHGIPDDHVPVARVVITAAGD